MYKKPECIVLSGEWGKQIYNDILTARQLDTPLYTESESRKFEQEFKKVIPDLVKDYKIAYRNV